MVILFFILACADQPEPQPIQPREPPVRPAEVDAQVADTGEPSQDLNRPPVITRLEINPAQPSTDSDLWLRVEVQDPDLDVIHIRKTWFKNDEPIKGQIGKLLPDTFFERGDRIYVKVEVDDGDKHVSGRTPEVLIPNAPPVIKNRVSELRRIDGFRVVAEDADGDRLSFHLEGAPRGLTIGPSGLLSYRGSEDDPGGAYKVAIVVEDGNGGFAQWDFGMNVAPGSATEKPREPETTTGNRRRRHQQRARPEEEPEFEEWVEEDEKEQE